MLSNYRHIPAACLLLAVLLCLAGCSTMLPVVASDSAMECPTAYGEPAHQNPSDICRKEVCSDGRMSVIENLSETAPVSDWAEEYFCLFHPIDCFRALTVKNHVRRWEQEMADSGFWDRSSLRSGVGDAARHAYLACLLTERFGNSFAKGLLDAHEEDSSVMFGFGERSGGNRCCDKVMDLHNNRVGIGLALQPGDCEEKVMDSLHLLRHSLCGR